MNPIILAFGAMFGWGFGDFFIQRTIRRIGPVGTLAWISFFSSLLIMPFIWQELAQLGRLQLWLLIILGLANFASGAIHFIALKSGKLSVVEILLSVELPLTILLGIIFFRESLSTFQIALCFILLIGLVLISLDPSELKRRYFLEKGAFLAAIGGILVAVVNFGTAAQSKALSPIMALALPWFICGLICLLSLTPKFKSFTSESRKNWKLVLVTVLVDLFAWVSYSFSVAREELAIVVAITESYVVVALILGVLVNKERLSRLQYVGAGLAVVASLLMGMISG